MTVALLWWVPAAPVLVLLLLFSLRRVILTATLWRAQPPLPEGPELPAVLVVVAVRDEADAIGALVAALDDLDYPPGLHQVVLVDDGSCDAGRELLPRLAAARGGWHVLRLEASVGKAQALNLALAAHPFGEVVYVLDADHRPLPDSLRIVVAAFADPAVAGVNGRMQISNPCASAATYYAAMESLVHQLITVRGSDVLGLAPPLLGANTGYRREALRAVGGYPRGAFLEDGNLTVMLHRAGYRTRFVPAAVSLHTAPPSLRGYLGQHIRWGRGFHDIAGAQLRPLLGDRAAPLPLRLELGLFTLGYLDRVAVLAALALLTVAPLRPVMGAALAVALALPLVQAVCALWRDRAPAALWWRLPILMPMFAVDVAAAVAASLLSVTRRERRWRRTERG